MDSMADIVISATIAGPITVTIATLSIAGESIAVFTGASATIIGIFTVIGDIETEIISTAIIGPTAEAIIATSLQVSFTPTHHGGIGLAIAKPSQNEQAVSLPR